MGLGERVCVCERVCTQEHTHKNTKIHVFNPGGEGSARLSMASATLPQFGP